MRISDWSSDVCSSDLIDLVELGFVTAAAVIIGDIPIPAFSTNRQIPAQSGDDPENVDIGPAGRAIGDVVHVPVELEGRRPVGDPDIARLDRKRTRMNSSH